MELLFLMTGSIVLRLYCRSSIWCDGLHYEGAAEDWRDEILQDGGGIEVLWVGENATRCW